MKVVLQDGIKDCGICCLLSIIRHYGGNVSKEYLRELTNTTKNGVTAYSIVVSAKKIGFEAYALNGSIEEIDVNSLPLIAHVIINKHYKHFIVIYEIDFINKKILIMDPSKGKKSISFSEFKLESSNNYIILKPKKKLPIFQEKKIIKNTIIKYILNNKILLIYLIVLTIIYFILNLLSAFHFKYLLDYAINYDIDKNVLLISITVLIIYLIKEIGAYLRSIIILKYSETFDEIITTKTYKQIILLPYLYYKNRTTGEVISRIKDLNIIKNYIIQIITSITTDFLSIVVFLIVLLNINKRLTYISVFEFIFIILLNYIYKSIIKKKTHKYYKQEEKINSYLVETLSSVDAIKGMHIEKKIIDKFSFKYKKYLETIYSLSMVNMSHKFLKNNINNITIVVLLYLGTIFVINGKITLSEFIIYQSINNFYLSSFINFINNINDYSKYKVSLERIEDMFTIKNEVFEAGYYYNNYTLEGNIKYKNLSYSYNSKKLLDKTSITIKYKDKVFLYGPSGTGKSTLVKMLMRYIEVPFGSISINNIDINHYHLDILRNNIVYVSQQEYLFNDTIYNNITLNRNIEKESVESVIKMVGLEELGSTDRLIEENGFNFSGGERQRIILARSILKNSSIYIFDEALSQIDVKKERDILINIFKYLKDKTVIVISHRFDNKDLFQRILRLEKGRIHEEKL